MKTLSIWLRSHAYLLPSISSGINWVVAGKTCSFHGDCIKSRWVWSNFSCIWMIHYV
jgi:hypothetical protein